LLCSSGLGHTGFAEQLLGGKLATIEGNTDEGIGVSIAT
jgi:hypothetical protein